MLRFGVVSLGDGGSRTCRLCHDSVALPYPWATIEERLKGAISLSENIMLSGFEPFLHPDLVKTVDAAASAGFTRIALHTDGGALAHAANVQGSIGAGIRIFEIVLQGGSSEVHDHLTKTLGLFDAAYEGVRNVHAVGAAMSERVAVVGVARICEHNAVHLADIVATFIRLGAVAVRIETEDPRHVDGHLLATASEQATVAGIALFGDGCERYLNGASLYTLHQVTL